MESQNQHTTWLAPVFLIVGGLAALIAGVVHGDLPEGSGSAALEFVADHPAYALVHIVSILGGVLWALGLAGWHVEGSSPTSRWLAEAAGRIALVGAAVLAVQFSLDGTGFEALVALGSEAGASTEVLATTAEIGADLIVGTALMWVALLYGLTPLLAGSSLILANRSILGWSGVALGAFSLIGGVLLALRVEVVPDWSVFAVGIVGTNLWIVALGALTLRS